MLIKKINTLFLATIAGCLFSLITLTSSAAYREAGYLEIVGKIKTIDHSVGVSIAIFKDGLEVAHYAPGANGKFDIKLELNAVYYMEVSAKGMISKTVMISTGLPNASLAWYEYEYKFNVELFPNLTTGEVKASTIPVAKIAYREKYDGFDYDRLYSRQAQNNNKTILAEN